MELDRPETLEKFRDDALRAIKGDLPKLQPRKRLQMMDKMPNQLRNIDMFRETFVLNAVLGECRPAAANRQMSYLRASRLKSGEYHKFETFEAMIQTYMGEVTFGPHGYRTRQLKDADVDVVFSEVRKLVSLLSDLGYPAFANAGTLLGLIRDGGLIAHDDDIDLAVMLGVMNDVDAAEEFQILLGQLLAEGVECRFLFEKNAIIKLPNIDGFEVDLFPAYGTQESYNIYPYCRGQLTIPDIWPLAPCEISGVPLPARPEVVLEVNYGPEWRTPDPRFTLPWMKLKEDFAPLISSLVEDDLDN